MSHKMVMPSNGYSPEYMELIESLRRHIPLYERLVLDNLLFLLDRHANNPDYPFIDTKVNLISGKDFAARTSGLDIYSRDIIYAWIQGRGLEALAAHLAWIPKAVSLPETRRLSLKRRLKQMLVSVLESMEALRQKNGGRLFFIVSIQGIPLQLDSRGQIQTLNAIPGPANFSDLFYAKGLYAAGRVLGRQEVCSRAEIFFRGVISAILSGTFVSDQQNMDPKNKVGEVPGRISHGPFMIALGGVALLLKSTVDQEWADLGETLIRHILQHHLSWGRFKGLEVWDFVEYLDSDGKPWRSSGQVILDPGHCIEYIGLSAKVLLTARAVGLATKSMQGLDSECREIFPVLLNQAFRLGFNMDQGGICKTYDLISRQPINTDMPWWSLPETLRTCVYLALLWPDLELAPLLTIYQQAHNAFFKHYVNADVYSMAYQTRDITGNPVEVVPAVPDADPCYHTGLSILDVLEVLYQNQS